MNFHFFMHRFFQIIIAFSALCTFSTTDCEEAPLDFFGVSDVQRVFEDGYQLPAQQDQLELFGIRNETVSAQCVIQPRQDLKKVGISIGPILHEDGSTALSSESVQWNFVGSILIQKNTSKLRKSDLIRTAPARFPDYLHEERTLSIPKGKDQAVYLTIQIPPDGKAGMYHGSVTLETDKGNRSLPISLTVYPLTLPEERHLLVTEWYSTGKFTSLHGIARDDEAAFDKMLSLYANNMAAHRQNVFQVRLNLIQSIRKSDGQYAFDYSKFDHWAELFWNTGGMDRLETGFIARFGEGGWSSHEVVLRDFSIYDEQSKKTERVAGKDFLPIFLPQLENHIREKGWLDKTLFHIADEPSNHNIMDWRACSEFVHRYAPSLRRIDAIETTHCLDRLEVWVPKLDILSTCFDAYQMAQREGNELWFYTVGIFQNGSLPNKTVDVPLIESRLLHWLNYRTQTTGYLHWGFNQWTDDPFEAPGEHNGDGWHVYPTKNGLLNSLRWEQMRNGIQDYECLWLLEEKTRAVIETLGDRFSILDPSRRSMEIASRVIQSFGEYDKNPATLYAAKKQIIEEILELEQSPRLIVQTNPIEHTAVAKDNSIDLFGYTEPGTKITVNGSEIPVADDGLFMENVGLTKEIMIVVEAENQKGKKRTIRSFEDLYAEKTTREKEK